MTISCIIPSYNQQDFLADAIESALEQTKPFKEIVVINDGSTDNSLEIALKYAKDGVVVLDQCNKGLASARNTGLMNTSADYILPLDADDILMEKCAEKILEKAEETKADIIAPSFKTFGVNNQEIILKDVPTLENFVSANRIGYFSAFRRDKAIVIGGYQSRLDNQWRDPQGNLKGGYEDYHLWIDMLKRGATIAIIEEPLVLYRTRPNTMIHEAQAHHNLLMRQLVKDHSSIYVPPQS